MTAPPVEPPELSLVIPCHNERGNLDALLCELHAGAKSTGLTYEIIITDDGSTDDSWKHLQALVAKDALLRVQKMDRNRGESAASWAGIRAARGRLIGTLDADLQNDPAELPLFIEALQHADCVCGTRVASRGDGDNALRILSSRVANGVRNWLSGENISDAGCTYRVFRRECVANVRFFHGMHRFLPTLIRMEGFTVTEAPIKHHPRQAGQSHYGIWNRLLVTIPDLLAVRWMKRRMFRFDVHEHRSR